MGLDSEYQELYREGNIKFARLPNKVIDRKMLLSALLCSGSFS